MIDKAAPFNSILITCYLDVVKQSQGGYLLTRKKHGPAFILRVGRKPYFTFSILKKSELKSHP